jgi:hypothetical protein
MDACFAVFFGFRNDKINQKQLSASVFKPVVHYLSHLLYKCRNLGFWECTAPGAKKEQLVISKI